MLLNLCGNWLISYNYLISCFVTIQQSCSLISSYVISIVVALIGASVEVTTSDTHGVTDYRCIIVLQESH